MTPRKQPIAKDRGSGENQPAVNFALTVLTICFKSAFRSVDAWAGCLDVSTKSGRYNAQRKWVSTMAKAELGLKRTCLSCGMRYYDFNRTPIICPGCQTEFDPELVVRSRRGRATVKADPKASKPEVVIEEEATVETENSDTVTDSADSSETDADPDISFDDDAINVDQDDSAGLIADDLDEDKEILPGIPNEDE